MRITAFEAAEAAERSAEMAAQLQAPARARVRQKREQQALWLRVSENDLPLVQVIEREDSASNVESGTFQTT